MRFWSCRLQISRLDFPRLKENQVTCQTWKVLSVRTALYTPQKFTVIFWVGWMNSLCVYYKNMYPMWWYWLQLRLSSLAPIIFYTVSHKVISWWICSDFFSVNELIRGAYKERLRAWMKAYKDECFWKHFFWLIKLSVQHIIYWAYLFDRFIVRGSFCLVFVWV